MIARLDGGKAEERYAGRSGIGARYDRGDRMAALAEMNQIFGRQYLVPEEIRTEITWIARMQKKKRERNLLRANRCTAHSEGRFLIPVFQHGKQAPLVAVRDIRTGEMRMMKVSCRYKKLTAIIERDMLQ